MIEAALRARGLYRDSLVLFSTDNGGAVAGESNLPLRGDKETLYQGGVRGVAWVAGAWCRGGGAAERTTSDYLNHTESLGLGLLAS